MKLLSTVSKSGWFKGCRFLWCLTGSRALTVPIGPGIKPTTPGEGPVSPVGCQDGLSQDDISPGNSQDDLPPPFLQHPIRGHSGLREAWSECRHIGISTVIMSTAFEYQLS